MRGNNYLNNYLDSAVTYHYDNSYNHSKQTIKRRKRRQRILRQRIVFAFTTIMLVVFLALTGFYINVKATGPDSKESTKYYSSIMIQPGDSLWSIASTYADSHYTSVEEYIKEIQQINHISENTILKSGNYLIIPYYKVS